LQELQTNLEEWTQFHESLGRLIGFGQQQTRDNRTRELAIKRLKKKFEKHVSPTYPHKNFLLSAIDVIDINAHYYAKYNYLHDGVEIHYYGREIQPEYDLEIIVDGTIIFNEESI
jgi:hypothetical protein